METKEILNAEGVLVEDKTKSIQELAETLKVNIGHRVEFVPFNSIEWAGGYISGVQVDPRSNKILYVIKTDDGKRVVKVHDAKYLRISEEVVEFAPRARKERPNDDELEQLKEDAAQSIGCPLDNGDRIIGVVCDKRSATVMWRIKGEDKIYNKVFGSKDIVVLERDEEGEAIFAARATRAPKTPQEKLEALQERQAKIEAQIEKLRAEFEANADKIATMKVEIEEGEESETEESEDDLM